jgi:hypothetical protein
VGAAIARRRDAPEDDDAEHQHAEIVGIGNREAEEVAQQHRDEDVERNHTDEKGGDPFNGIDESVHRFCECGMSDHRRSPGCNPESRSRDSMTAADAAVMTFSLFACSKQAFPPVNRRP